MTSPRWHIDTIYGWLDVGEWVAAAPRKSASAIFRVPLCCRTPVVSHPAEQRCVMQRKWNYPTESVLFFSPPTPVKEPRHLIPVWN